MNGWERRRIRDHGVFWVMGLCALCACVLLVDPLRYILTGIMGLGLFLVFPAFGDSRKAGMLIIALSVFFRLAWGPGPVSAVPFFVETAAVFVFLHYLSIRRLNARWALLYAVNPLVLSLAGSGAGLVFFLFLALAGHARGRHTTMFLSLGACGLLFPWALWGLPFFMTVKNRLKVPAALVPLSFLFVPGVHAWLQAFWGPTQGGFGANPFPGPFAPTALLMGLGEATSWAWLVCPGLVLVVGIVLFRAGGPMNRDGDPLVGMLWTFGTLFLCSASLAPELLCLTLGFALMYRKFSWLVLTYCLWIWTLPGGLTPEFRGLFIWLPFGCFLCVDLWMGIRRWPVGPWSGPVGPVSVIIPVLNEAEQVAACVTRILEDPAVCEVIVVDGGSRDATVKQASSAGARVVCHDAPPERGGGRGGQIGRGLLETTGDVVAVVHADTRIETGSFSFLRGFLEKNPRVVGGALGCVFDHTGLRLKVIDALNTLRAALFFVSFGDQIQYFRRKPVVMGHVFPDIPLMEDVELSLRLSALGQTVYHFGESRVSSRRWHLKGAANAFTVLRYFSSYMVQRLWGRPDTLSMYRRYYGE